MDSSRDVPGGLRDDWDERIRVLLPKVYRYLAYRVGDGRVAEDLTGDTFERAWRNRSRFNADRGDWSAWVIGIARHVAADHYRHRRRAETQAADAHEPLERPTESAYERRATFSQMTSMLSALPDRERELVAMKYGAELTNRAIAGLTGLTESNVGTILHRTVSALRRNWEERG